MAKLSIVEAFLLLCLLTLASANTFTVTTTVTEDETCQRQIQTKKIDHCREYLSSGPKSHGEELSMVTNEDDDEEERKECCKELKKFGSEECRCEALMGMVIQEHGQDMRLAKRASSLPRKCGLQRTHCPY